MLNLSFLSCVRHLNFKRWIETINSTKKIGNTFSFFLSLLEINKCWRICRCNLCAPWFSIAEHWFDSLLYAALFPFRHRNFFGFVCFFSVRYEAGTEFSMECLIQLRWTSLVIHLFHSVFLSIGDFSVQTRERICLVVLCLFIYFFYFVVHIVLISQPHIYDESNMHTGPSTSHIYRHQHSLLLSNICIHTSIPINLIRKKNMFNAVFSIHAARQYDRK